MPYSSPAINGISNEAKVIIQSEKQPKRDLSNTLKPRVRPPCPLCNNMRLVFFNYYYYYFGSH